MGINLKVLDKLSKGVLDTLKRFPMATLSTFIVTIILVSLLEIYDLKLPTNTHNILILKKIALVASLGIFLFPALRLLFPNIIMSFIGIAILTWYYTLLPPSIEEHNVLFRHTILMIAVFLMLFWTPFMAIKISNKNIWEWTQHLILSFVSSIFFSILLYIGIALALFSIEKLFNIDIASIRYAQIAIVIFGIYGVNMFLTQIPKYIILLQSRTYTKAEEVFTKYILSALTIGYFLIIFIYSLKILVSMEWPSGIVAWISVIFSLIAIITYLFWTPLLKDKDSKFKTAIWGAILFQTLMLGFALYLRIKEYGFTENRYFIALFGIWLLLMSLYFLLINKASYKWLFVTLTLLLIGSQFGKYSALEFSKIDQLQRVETLINKKDNLSPKEQQSLYSAVSYIYSRDKLNSLKGILPKDIIKEYNDLNQTYKNRVYFPNFMVKKLGLKDINNKHRYIHFTTLLPRRVISVKGFNWLVEFNYNKNYSKSLFLKHQNIQLSFEKNIITLKDEKRIIKIDLTPIIDSLGIERKDSFVSITNQKLEYRTKDVKILFYSIGIDTKNREITDFIAKILF